MYGSIEEDEELRKPYVEEHLNMKLNSTQVTAILKVVVVGGYVSCQSG